MSSNSNSLTGSLQRIYSKVKSDNTIESHETNENPSQPSHNSYHLCKMIARSAGEDHSQITASNLDSNATQQSSQDINNINARFKLITKSLAIIQPQEEILLTLAPTSSASRGRHGPLVREHELHKSVEQTYRNRLHRHTPYFKPINLKRYCQDWTLHDYTSLNFGTETFKNLKLIRNWDTTFPEELNLAVYKTKRGWKGSPSSDIDINKGRYIVSKVDVPKFLIPLQPYTFKNAISSAVNSLQGSFSKFMDGESSTPLLEQLLKRSIITAPERTVALPLLLPHSYTSSSASQLSQLQIRSNLLPTPQSPLPTTSCTSSFSPKSWLVSSQQNHYYREHSNDHSGGGGERGGSSNDEDDSSLSSEDRESDSEDDHRRNRDKRIHRDQSSKNEAITNILAAAIAAAAAASASAEASAYSADAASASASAALASSRAASESAAASSASAAAVTALSSDPFPGAAKAFESMVSIPQANSTSQGTTLTSVARPAQQSFGTSPCDATYDHHRTNPPTATSTSSVTPIIDAYPTQIFTTPVLDFIELAYSTGIMDAELFSVCYAKALAEFEASETIDQHRYERLTSLSEYYNDLPEETLNPTDRHLSPEAQSYDMEIGSRDEDSNSGSGGDDNNDSKYHDDEDNGDESDDNNGSDSDNDSADKEVRRDNFNRGGNMDESQDDGGESYLTAAYDRPRSILKRRSNEYQGGSNRMKKRHRTSRLGFCATTEVQYYYLNDMPHRSSLEMSTPVQTALSGHYKPRKRKLRRSSRSAPLIPIWKDSFGTNEEDDVENDGDTEDEVDQAESNTQHESNAQCKADTHKVDIQDEYRWLDDEQQMWESSVLSLENILQDSYQEEKQHDSESDSNNNDNTNYQSSDTPGDYSGNAGESEHNCLDGDDSIECVTQRTSLTDEEAMRSEILDLERYMNDCSPLVTDRSQILNQTDHSIQDQEICTEEHSPTTTNSRTFGVDEILDYELGNYIFHEEGKESVKNTRVRLDKGKGRHQSDIQGAYPMRGEGSSSRPVSQIRSSCLTEDMGHDSKQMQVEADRQMALALSESLDSNIESYWHGNSMHKSSIKIDSDDAKSESSSILPSILAKRRRGKEDSVDSDDDCRDQDNDLRSKRARNCMICDSAKEFETVNDKSLSPVELISVCGSSYEDTQISNTVVSSTKAKLPDKILADPEVIVRSKDEHAQSPKSEKYTDIATTTKQPLESLQSYSVNLERSSYLNSDNINPTNDVDVLGSDSVVIPNDSTRSSISIEIPGTRQLSSKIVGIRQAESRSDDADIRTTAITDFASDITGLSRSILPHLQVIPRSHDPQSTVTTTHTPISSCEATVETSTMNEVISLAPSESDNEQVNKRTECSTSMKVGKRKTPPDSDLEHGSRDIQPKVSSVPRVTLRRSARIFERLERGVQARQRNHQRDIVKDLKMIKNAGEKNQRNKRPRR
ncbi:hypothetical protein BGZ46_004500 [Entomortierella lignicola]|nr:hypothetical protein BGZ46_004500 [Entomortierella lignicola]